MISSNMHALYSAITEVAKAYADQSVVGDDYTSRDFAFTEVIKAEQKLENALNELEARINGANT